MPRMSCGIRLGGGGRPAKSKEHRGAKGAEAYRSRVRMLSCQRCSSSQDKPVKNRKIRMPVIEIRNKAANMRGMLSRKPDSTMR